MDLSKGQKIILGIFTFLPFVLLPFVLWQVLHVVLDIIKINAYDEPDPGEIISAVFTFIVPIGLIAFCSLALLIFYIVHAIINKKLEPAEQLLWVLFFIFFGVIAFPIYWFVRIWNNSNKS